MRTLQGKRALVTGACGGLGRALVSRLVDEGMRVALLDVDEAGLQNIDDADFRDDAKPLRIPCDLADGSQIKAAVDRLLTEWGGIDLLVNNAGIVYYGKSHVMTQAEWDRMLAVNLTGPIQLTRLLLPHLLAEPESHIVNVSSVYGFMATNRSTAYHVTKYGLVGFSEALRAEYAGKNLGVTVLCPSFVRETGLFTSMSAGSGQVRVPPAWICTTAERIADQAVRAVYRNRRMVLTGWLSKLLHFSRRLMPGFLDWLYHIRRPRLFKLRRTKRRTQVADSAR